MTVTEVDFYFDPSCEWTWITSRWLVEASIERDLRVTWHPYSLVIKQGDGIADDKRERFQAGLRALRVIVEVIRRAGNEAAGTFYAERSYRLFGSGGQLPEIQDVLEASGLDTSFAAAADDTSLDDNIQASMDEAHRLAGSSNGSPVISIRGSGRGFFGPVLTAVPPADLIGPLWDHLAGIFSIPEFRELKADRTEAALPPARP